MPCDAGLLDHLLKHLADQEAGPEGERLRRRHDKEGHMVYWLQSPQDVEQGGCTAGFWGAHGVLDRGHMVCWMALGCGVGWV